MEVPTRRYRSADEDSARWDRFDLRRGDVVISTRSKHGTTWVQAICAMFIHGSPELPAPLAELSPWLDWLVEPIDDVVARLDDQPDRRVIKTHTPLDGVPIDPAASYIVVARDPLDAAVSLYHQGRNLDRARMAELTGRPEVAAVEATRRPVDAWLRAWVAADADPVEDLDSLRGVFHHLADAWARRHEPNVHLVHYADLSSDLDREMSRIAGLLGVDPAALPWASLVGAATFGAMSRRAERVVPDRFGVLVDRGRFFRRGALGEGEELLDTRARARYRDRVASLAPGDLLEWLLR
ncbi:MAG: sulfotransferase domain-containing protein [Acidimicrobiia bacterium]|nr:sulfotransferase domain-containing protein [Acidimicrobiia bacterium]